MNPEDLTNALGRAVTAIWGDLPAAVQHDLFESTVRLSGQACREQLATFLHHAHPRTAEGRRRAQHQSPIVWAVRLSKRPA